MARLKREVKAERRRIREERAAQRMAQELADRESKKKHSPWQKRLAEAQITALEDGIRIGRSQVLTELEQKGCSCMKSSESN